MACWLKLPTGRFYFKTDVVYDKKFTYMSHLFEYSNRKTASVEYTQSKKIHVNRGEGKCLKLIP